jgi:hypothetical protein
LSRAGDEGAGKGIFFQVFIYLLGQHAIQVSNPKHLVGAFNVHLRDCVFLFADEPSLRVTKPTRAFSTP